MSRLTDPDFLRNEQYRNSGNLSKRASLHRDFGTNPISWQTWLMGLIDLPANALILDLGSGPGYFWQENQKTIPVGWKVWLTDISGGMLRESRAVLRGKNSFCYLVVDAVDIPFPEGFFDAVIANHMLYHVKNLDQALTEIRRVLKDSGIFYAATNGSNHLKEINDLEAEIIDDEKAVKRFWAEKFRLENGSDVLSDYFDTITRYDYPNQLQVTDPNAIIAYVDSKSDLDLEPEQIATLQSILEKEIRAKGNITITAHAGVFQCR